MQLMDHCLTHSFEQLCIDDIDTSYLLTLQLCHSLFDIINGEYSFVMAG